MSDWKLPRMTGDLAADWIAAARAMDAASTDAQRAAVALRVQMLRERNEDIGRQVVGVFDRMRVVWAPVFRDLARSFASWQELIRQRLESVEVAPLASVARNAPVLDPIARARAGRGSGPPPRPLDPRRRRR